MKRVLLLSLLGALLTGCSSVEICREGGHTLVDIENTGWYLFNFIPLASGDPTQPNANTCRLFTDTVTLENNMRLLDWAAQQEYAGAITDVKSYLTDENVLIFLFKRHAYHTNAELLKEKPCESADMSGN